MNETIQKKEEQQKKNNIKHQERGKIAGEIKIIENGTLEE